MARSEQEPQQNKQRKREWVTPPGGLRIVGEVWSDPKTRLRPVQLTPKELQTLARTKNRTETTLFKQNSADGE